MDCYLNAVAPTGINFLLFRRYSVDALQLLAHILNNLLNYPLLSRNHRLNQDILIPGKKVNQSLQHKFVLD